MSDYDRKEFYNRQKYQYGDRINRNRRPIQNPYGYGPPKPVWKYAPRKIEYESPTAKGLFLMIIALILTIIGTLFSVCGILTIIGLVIAAIGFLKIYNDRFSYPEPHFSNVEISLKFYIIGWIILFIVAFYIVGEAFSFATKMIDYSTSASDAFDSLLLHSLYASIIGFVGTIFIVLARYKLLIELIPPNLKNFLYFTVIITIVISIVIIAVNFAMYDQLTGSFEEKEDEIFGDEENLDRNERLKKNQELLEEFQTDLQGYQWLTGGLTSLTYLLFILCFYFAYNHQKTKSSNQ
jgi:hypothetical protein